MVESGRGEGRGRMQLLDSINKYKSYGKTKSKMVINEDGTSCLKGPTALSCSVKAQRQNEKNKIKKYAVTTSKFPFNSFISHSSIR